MQKNKEPSIGHELQNETFTRIKNQYIIAGTNNSSELDSILQQEYQSTSITPILITPITNNSEDQKHEFNENFESLVNKDDSLAKLLKLKSFDILTIEEVKEIICFELFNKELKNSLIKKDHVKTTDIDDITREILYITFLQYKLIIPQNNNKKMKIKDLLQEDEVRKLINIKLKE